MDMDCLCLFKRTSVGNFEIDKKKIHSIEKRKIEQKIFIEKIEGLLVEFSIGRFDCR